MSVRGEETAALCMVDFQAAWETLQIKALLVSEHCCARQAAWCFFYRWPNLIEGDLWLSIRREYQRTLQATSGARLWSEVQINHVCAHCPQYYSVDCSSTPCLL